MTAVPKTLRSPADLAEAGLVAPDRLRELEGVAAQYAVAVTPAMVELINPHDAHDPIARQFLPDPAELVIGPEDSADPISDFRHAPVEGIVHRYPDRVLLKPVHVCAVYCRFCFRREMVGPGGVGSLSPEALRAALAYIESRPEIWEVIVTGGDPFVMAPRRLRDLVQRLGAIPHVKVIRFTPACPWSSPSGSRRTWSKPCGCRTRPSTWPCTPTIRAS